jgi:hypothetical protein
MESNWAALMAEAEKYYGPAWAAKKKDIMHSFREEYPAGADEWARLFGKAGFKILKRLPKCSFYGSLLAVKT